MAKTMTPGQAIQLLSLKYRQILSDGVAGRFADEVQAYIWYKYPWRGSLAELPPFHPVSEEPDYGPPLYAVPSDFYGLHNVWVRDSSGRKYDPLVIRPFVEISATAGFPSAIAYHDERTSFRLHPRPTITAPDYWIEGIYKKLPTKIVNETLNSYVLPWDDIYFQVFKKGMEWKIKDELVGSQDAVNTFQWFEMLVDQMAMAEGLHSGVSSVAPSEGLELGG